MRRVFIYSGLLGVVGKRRDNLALLGMVRNQLIDLMCAFHHDIFAVGRMNLDDGTVRDFLNGIDPA